MFEKNSNSQRLSSIYLCDSDRSTVFFCRKLLRDRSVIIELRPCDSLCWWWTPTVVRCGRCRNSLTQYVLRCNIMSQLHSCSRIVPTQCDSRQTCSSLLHAQGYATEHATLSESAIWSYHFRQLGVNGSIRMWFNVMFNRYTWCLCLLVLVPRHSPSRWMFHCLFHIDVSILHANWLVSQERERERERERVRENKRTVRGSNRK